MGSEFDNFFYKILLLGNVNTLKMFFLSSVENVRKVTIGSVPVKIDCTMTISF